MIAKANQERAEAENLGRIPRRKVVAKTQTKVDESEAIYGKLPLFSVEINVEGEAQ